MKMNFIRRLLKCSNQLRMCTMTIQNLKLTKLSNESLCPTALSCSVYHGWMIPGRFKLIKATELSLIAPLGHTKVVYGSTLM